MQISQTLLPLLLLLSLTTTTTSSSSSSSDLVSELLTLQSQSPSGVIHLTDQSLQHFLTSTPTPRPYSLIIFFDATQLHDKTELHLQQLRSEFDLVASAFLAHNLNTPAQSKLFFCDIEFKQSQTSFSLFGVNSLPHVRFINPDVKNPKDSDPMDQSHFARLADSMAEFVQAKSHLTVGPIARPPIVSRTQVGIMMAVMVISAPFAVRRIFRGDTLLNDSKMWLAGAVFVYFFSVSGAMHNIIRKMPMFLADQNDPTKIQFFYQGSGMQLGAEGFAVGFLYTIVGLLLAFATHLLVKVRNRNVQRVFMIFALLVSFWAVNKVVYLDNWKTGYGIHGFWPSSWR